LEHDLFGKPVSTFPDHAVVAKARGLFQAGEPPPFMLGIVGAAPPLTGIKIDITEFMQMAKTIYGIIEGDSVPDVFIPQLIDFYLQGRFPFDKLVKFYPFERSNQAAKDSERGLTAKPIIRIGKI
jgi:aryl-alcohol dehydrogenase